MSIDRLILVINGQSIMQVFVIIDCHQLSVTSINQLRMDQYLLLNNIDFHRLPILIDHLFDKCLLNTSSLKYTFCTVCYILLAKTTIIIRFIRKNNIPRLKTCNGNNFNTSGEG